MNTKIRLFPKKIIYFALYFVKSLPFLVIQTTEGRKNLDSIKSGCTRDSSLRSE